ncbi:hypothetical protein Pint_31983 [Pistacia integerrima]|uniref:Uncharacterized protein n=1 Tax=Pistacia integerrima TaxID=434235 RepID=A0ACC0XTV2_9ROSI|nr:hypothetical protein Pint_31983 [Pistacia integerrima]
MGVVRLYNIEDARQYTLAAEKRISRYGVRKPIDRTNWKNNLGPRRGYQTGQREWKETTTTNKTNRGATNVERSDKGKSIVSYGGQNNSSSSVAKGGNNSQVMITTIKDEEEYWRGCSIFRTRVVCGGKVCDLVIDGGSTENIISKEVVDKLKLPTITHPHPYKVGWFKKGHKILITSQCLVKVTTGGNLEDEALCVIVPMDVGHILVGRPWLFDHDMDHKTKPNTYSFYKDNKTYTLYPLKEKAKQLATKSSTTSKTIGYLNVEKCNAEHGEMGIMYALINKIVENDQILRCIPSSCGSARCGDGDEWLEEWLCVGEDEEGGERVWVRMLSVWGRMGEEMLGEVWTG